MTTIQTRAIQAIEAQQAAVRPRSMQWQVGEQLKDICRREPKSAELIAQDLENEAMSITEAEKKIKAFADKHREKNATSSGVSYAEAEDILREFYGLPAPDAKPAPTEPAAVPLPAAPPPSGVIDLTDFL